MRCRLPQRTRSEPAASEIGTLRERAATRWSSTISLSGQLAHRAPRLGTLVDLVQRYRHRRDDALREGFSRAVSRA